MFALLSLTCVVLAGRAAAQGAGDCMCVTADPLNVRDGPCGNPIGSAYNGQCFKHKGGKQVCSLSGTSYEFHQFDFNGRDGWAAINFLAVDNSKCQGGGSGEGYGCELRSQGMRVHETSSPTIYDCKDNGCGNTCQGGQCVALVTCSCRGRDTNQFAPSTTCWRPGTKVANNGVCNNNIPANTAIATFSGSNYYAGHAAIFVGCDGNSIRVYDQWCCRNIGYSSYSSSHSYHNDFYVITRAAGCADRPSWSCRWESAGGTCCPTYAPGCLKQSFYSLFAAGADQDEIADLN